MTKRKYNRVIKYDQITQVGSNNDISHSSPKPNKNQLELKQLKSNHDRNSLIKHSLGNETIINNFRITSGNLMAYEQERIISSIKNDYDLSREDALKIWQTIVEKDHLWGKILGNESLGWYDLDTISINRDPRDSERFTYIIYYYDNDPIEGVAFIG